MEEEKRSWRMYAPALGFLGCQIAWAVQIGYATPVLRTVGLKDSTVAFVWLAGPVSGAVVQPLIGAWSDRCESRFGRRRPFILAGALIAGVGLISFSLAPWIQHFSTSVIVAVVSFWMLDAAINVAQGPLRALIADSASRERGAHASANAIFAAANGCGKAIGYTLGALTSDDSFFSVPALFATTAAFNILLAIVSTSLSHDPPLRASPSKHSAVSAFDADDAANTGDIDGGDEKVVVGGLSSSGDLMPDFGLRGSGSLASTLGGSLGRSFGGGSFGGSSFAADDVTAAHGNGSGGARTTTMMGGVPRVVWKAMAVQFWAYFGWYCSFVYWTDWSGAEVLGGSPEAASLVSPTPAQQHELALFETGVRAANAGLCTMSLISVPLSFLLPMLLRAFRDSVRVVWAAGMMTLAAILACTSFATSARDVFILTAFFSFPLAVTMTIPWTVVTTAAAAAAASNTHTNRRPDDDQDHDGGGRGGGRGGGAASVTAVFNISQCMPEIAMTVLCPLVLRLNDGRISAVLLMGAVGTAIGSVVAAAIRWPNSF